jgi:hypothetical protein
MESTWGNTPVSQSSAEVQLGFIPQTLLLFHGGILSAVVGWRALCLNVRAGLELLLWRFAKSPSSRWSLSLAAALRRRHWPTRRALTTRALRVHFAIGIVFTPIIAMYAPASGRARQRSHLDRFGSLHSLHLCNAQRLLVHGRHFVRRHPDHYLAGAANLFFFKSSGFSYWMAWAMLFFSSGFVLYQTRTSSTTHRRDTVAAALGLVHLVLQHLHVAAAHPGRQPRLIARDRIAIEYSKGRGALASRPFCVGAAGVIH